MTTAYQRLPMRRHPPPDPGENIQIATFRPSLPRVIIACAAVLATTGCSLRTPGCGNRDVKASLERDARASAEQWMSTTSCGSLLPADAQFVVSGSYETFRAENTRECSATMTVGSGDNQVAVPIEYEVIAADDGQLLYRWDDAAFGKSFIANAIMSGVQGDKSARPRPRRRK